MAEMVGKKRSSLVEASPCPPPPGGGGGGEKKKYFIKKSFLRNALCDNTL